MERSLPQIRMRLTPRAETLVRRGHPWIFDGSIREANREGETGERVVIYDRKNKFLAVGLLDTDSPIRVRVLHSGKPLQIDGDWIRSQMEAALALREGIGDSETTGLRLINGENDGLPGLVLDRYAETLVLKLYTAAWLPWLPDLLEEIRSVFAPENIVLRMSRNMEADAMAHGELRDGDVLVGTVDDAVLFKESGLRFFANVRKGQKTGFFLDQRDNRRRVETLAHGRRVLNLFSFTGGFSLYAARGGAASVVSVDVSAHALAGLRDNWQLNEPIPAVAACQHEEIQADVFAWLDDHQDLYDMIICDPPSLAKRAADVDAAKQAYRQLASAASRCLAHGGILLCCSCSARVSPEAFELACDEGIARAGRELELVAVSGHPPDHPVRVPELLYLKSLCYREPSRYRDPNPA